MLASRFGDKEKNSPVGAAVVVEGIAVRRNRGMIYWYRWGRHTFDIRVVRKVLGLPVDSLGDKYFMDGSEYAGDGDKALSDNISAITSVLDGATFKSVVKQHDAIIIESKF